jgi:hypothetical protein
MMPSDTVLAYSRVVKTAVATVAVGLLPVILGLQVLFGTLGASTRDHVTGESCDGAACALTPAARELVGQLENEGLTCRPSPTMTDTVVFSWADGRVETVDFGTSLTATAKAAGQALRYCATPR